MKLNTWLNSGFSARGDHSDTANWLVWFPADLDTLTAGPLAGDSGSVPFYLTPKSYALGQAGDNIVLLGIPLGELDGSWRLSDRAGAGTDVRSVETLDEVPGLLGEKFAQRTDSSAVVQVRGQFPIEKIQVVAGQNRPATRRAIDILRGVASDFDGERQFHTMPELFPEEQV
ncbi:DUF4433 domain-containing protein [Corynebacterium sp. TA-R-1]|uniref:DUF4433 domain-containing protein n=1 Tax=Corynebacterium stercoris TaxID=2943490 RepID=A0ABT1G2I1_9CORY|nr:DUF4433 domain-containing protein [Corynebacterium stercoris]MCP1388200.1 DUF4433 domain-containing protein [Corynebacterium stercoris]